MHNLLTNFRQKWQRFLCILRLKFNVSLTNNVVCCKHPNPGYCVVTGTCGIVSPCVEKGIENSKFIHDVLKIQTMGEP